VIWEYFCENTLPSLNDLINTPISGSLFGEMEYRLSSNILNEKKTGTERVIREVGAALVNPMRGFNRLIKGETSRVSSKDIYQKEPLNITVSAGGRWANNGSSFGTGPGNATLDMILDYGDPFEYRSRNPYDQFRLWGNLYFGAGDKVLDNIVGYGILYGENYQCKNLEVLAGIFQHYDYWNTSTFELSTLAFSGGVLTKLPLGKNKTLLTNFHLGVVPMAANDSFAGPTGTDVRDYNYGDGVQTELESTFKAGRLSLVFVGYYYWVHNYAGVKGDSYIGILKPRISFAINECLSVGFEYMLYNCNKYLDAFPQVHDTRTEQKLYVSYFFEDPWYDR
jgi:hypothetical protein